MSGSTALLREPLSGLHVILFTQPLGLRAGLTSQNIRKALVGKAAVFSVGRATYDAMR